MTKKDYILIAQVMSETKRELDEYKKEENFDNETYNEKRLTWKNVQAGLALALASENPAFDFRKFDEACGA